jgi:hypothetical protein
MRYDLDPFEEPGNGWPGVLIGLLIMSSLALGALLL